jgi:hypothetical protein
MRPPSWKDGVSGGGTGLGDGPLERHGPKLANVARQQPRERAEGTRTASDLRRSGADVSAERDEFLARASSLFSALILSGRAKASARTRLKNVSHGSSFRVR